MHDFVIHEQMSKREGMKSISAEQNRLPTTSVIGSIGSIKGKGLRKVGTSD